MTEERWHNFAKEKPSEDMEGRNFIVSNGHYEKIATWCGYWENEPFMGDHLCDEVVSWKFYFTPEEEKANEATRTEQKPMKCDKLKPLVFSISDLAYVDEPTPQPNFQNPHDHAVYKATEVDAAVAELKARIQLDDDEMAGFLQLEEERRWRKCSEEMPQNYEDGETFLIAVEHESTTCPKGYYVTIAELVDGKWSDEEGRDIDEDFEYDLKNSAFRSQVPKGTKKGFWRSKVTHWMPLPNAPKEATK